MITFTLEEIFLSIICAVIYGAIFFAFSVTLNVLISLVKELKRFVKNVLLFDKILQNKLKKRGRKYIFTSSALDFILTLLFFFGFILLSYFSLDGEVRGYMLLLSVGSFLLCRHLLLMPLISLALTIADWLFFGTLVLIRCLILPIKLIYFRFIRKFFLKLK